MIIDLFCAADDERILVRGPRLPFLEMACDILQAVMEYEGDGTVQIFEDDEGTEEWRESIVTMTPREALDRVLTWMLDDDEGREGLTAILDQFEEKPANWDWWRKFLSGGVIHLRDNMPDDLQIPEDEGDI